jgi:phosphoribosylformylglycinamidine synthase
MGELVGCIRGIGEACRALDSPSCPATCRSTNETNGRGILPTRPSAASGLLDDAARHATIAFKREGDAYPARRGDQGLARPIPLPSRRLRPRGGRAAARRPRRRAPQRRFRPRPDPSALVDTVHDCSDGGLAVALAEMAMAGGIGAVLPDCPVDLPCHAYLFGEDGGRYLLAVDPDAAVDLLYAAVGQGVPIAIIA